MKKVIAAIIVLLVLGAGIAGFFVWRHHSLYISKSEAVAIALADAQVGEKELKEIDTDFEKTKFSAWYEVDFETHGMEYEYSIDAVSGEILSSNEKPDR